MKKSRKILSLLLSCVLALGSFSCFCISASANESEALFEETFEEGFAEKTTYNGKTGAWSSSDGDGLLWNDDGGEGKIYENRNEAGGMQFLLDDGQEYTEAMFLEVTADILAGQTDSNDYARVDVIGSIEDDGHHRISLCSFSGGKIYANTMNNGANYDTGATYEANKRYIAKGVIDETNETFTLSVYDKETGNAVLENYVVPNYKHEKSNWQKMTAGFKGINFYANRTGNGSPAYSLYSISVKRIQTALFEETFEEGFGNRTAYGDRAGAWTNSEGDDLSWNYDGGEGKIYAGRNQKGGMQFIFDDGQEYTEAMILEVTADVLAGATDKADSARVDIIGSIEDDGHHRITLCSFSGGKIYANTTGSTEARDTGATYEADKRYIVKGVIDEINETFTLSVYDKATGEAVLEDFNVDPYKHDKSNWQKMTAGFKGVNFYADRTESGSPAYSLYRITVKEVPTPWVVEQNNITLKDANDAVQAWDSVAGLSTVAIDFGKAMDETTLTENTVYIENTTTKEKIDYTGSYAGNIYTLAVEGKLEANATYNIVITDDVATAKGVANSATFSFATIAVDDTILFEETFESGYADKTVYNGKTGAWSSSDGDGLLWNYDGGEGKIYENRNELGGMQFKFDDGQEYNEAMKLEVTADILTGPTDKADYARVDIIGSIEDDGHHRISLCSFSGGKIYANTMNNGVNYDTGAIYEANKRYIAKGVIDETNETFTLSVYDKETGNAVLENYVVPNYKHEKSNWQKMTAGFKGINFYANRTGNGSPAYSLYSIKVRVIKEFLFQETFEEGFKNKTTYGGKTGAWSASESNDLLWNYDGGEGKIYANRNQIGGLQFKFNDGQEYTDAMALEVTADILTGPTDKTDYCRVDIIGAIERDAHHRISLCSFSSGKIYANTMSTSEARDTGATYESGKRYIVKGIIDEVNRIFKLSVYDKETGSAILENYNVTPYKHDKSNWYEMTNGFKGINFYANRAQSGSPAYSLYSISVKEIEPMVMEALVDGVTINGSDVTSIAQLKTGDKLNVSIDYKNTTGEDKTLYLIVAGYAENGNWLNVGYSTKDVDKSVTEDTFEIESSELDLEEVDYIKIMLWDGLDTLVPLSVDMKVE